MGLFKRIAGFLGFSRDNPHDDDRVDDDEQQDTRPVFQETGVPRKGFGVQVQVAVDRPHVGPVLIPCTSGDGGVQVHFLLYTSVFCFLFN